MTAALQQPADPRRMSAYLYGDAHRLPGGQSPLECLGCGTQPTFFDHLAACGIQKAQVAPYLSPRSRSVRSVVTFGCSLLSSPSAAPCYYCSWADPPFLGG